MLSPLPVEGGVVKLSIQYHVRLPSRFPRYGLPLEHGKLSDQAGFIMMLTLKVVGIGAVFSSLLHLNGELLSKRRWL